MTAFTVPKSEVPELAAKDENRFTFKLKANGKVYSLPKLEFLPRESAKVIRASIGQVTEADLLRKLVEIECPDAFEAVDALEDDQAEALSTAWVDSSAVSVGESTASEAS
ncbi:hypothetical protein ACH47B_13355 [Rhodococcus sp. NPDC019627]|uniref:hypothetical protein n=1 Tax=unclassified Rhodococcus (in: high G+C Gram-positive bacteria) TaxID=192944 RepID=UPI0033C39D00